MFTKKKLTARSGYGRYELRFRVRAVRVRVRIWLGLMLTDYHEFKKCLKFRIIMNLSCVNMLNVRNGR